MKKAPSRTLKLIFDIVLLAFLALLYSKRAVSMKFHEWGGLALGALFLVHKGLNFRWIRSVTAGIFRGKVKLNGLWIVDLLLLIAMAAVLVTGLFISKTLPTALRNGRGLQTWHYFAAAVSLLLTGVHLGWHWPLIKAAAWDKLRLPGKWKTAAGLVLLCALLGCGGYSLKNSSTVSWLTRPFTVRMPAGQRNGMPAGRRFEGEAAPELAADPSFAAPEAAQGKARAQEREAGGTDRPREMSPGKGQGGAQFRGASSGPWRTLFTFSSVILLFAAVTALLRGLIARLKKRGASKK